MLIRSYTEKDFFFVGEKKLLSGWLQATAHTEEKHITRINGSDTDSVSQDCKKLFLFQVFFGK